MPKKGGAPMTRLNITLQHCLPQEEALKRVRGLLGEELKNEISNLQEEWRGNIGRFRCTARGFPASGTITVKSSTVDLVADVDLPFPISLLKGQIEQTIRKRAQTLLT